MATKRRGARLKPREFWVVISTGKYPGALYVHWADHPQKQVLTMAHDSPEDCPDGQD